MPEEENTSTTESEKGGNAGRTAAKAAVAAAATGAAAVAVKKVLDSRSNGSNGSSNGDDSGARTKSGDTKALVTSIASGSWDAAQDALVPLAGDVAAAAGKYVAQNGPDVIKDQIIPKFIEAFNEAR